MTQTDQRQWPVEELEPVPEGEIPLDWGGKELRPLFPALLPDPNDPRGRLISIVEVPAHLQNEVFDRVFGRFWVKFPRLLDPSDEQLVAALKTYRKLFYEFEHKHSDYTRKYNSLLEGEQTGTIPQTREECGSKGDFYGAASKIAKTVVEALAHELKHRIESRLLSWSMRQLGKGSSAQDVVRRVEHVKCFFCDDPFLHPFVNRMAPGGILKSWEELQELP